MCRYNEMTDEALIERLRAGESAIADYLMENVAIATIGDVMDLVDENRIFVKQGLDMLKRTENLGLKALMGCTGVNVDKLSTYHIGFVIGPCMNASGRLDTAKRALELLNASNRREAVTLAADLKELNDSRKEMTEEGVEEAVRQIGFFKSLCRNGCFLVKLLCNPCGNRIKFHTVNLTVLHCVRQHTDEITNTAGRL